MYGQLERAIYGFPLTEDENGVLFFPFLLYQ